MSKPVSIVTDVTRALEFVIGVAAVAVPVAACVAVGRFFLG